MTELAGQLPAGGAFLTEPVTARKPFSVEDFSADELSLASTAEEFVRTEVLPLIDEIEAKKDGVMPALLRRAGPVRRDGRIAPSRLRSVISRRASANSAGVYSAKSRRRNTSRGLKRTVTTGASPRSAFPGAARCRARRSTTTPRPARRSAPKA